MPIAVEEGSAAVTVRLSAAADMVWLLLWLQERPGHKTKPALQPLEPLPRALVDRARGFWDDGSPFFSEIVVLAHAGGHLFDSTPEAFLDELASRMPALGDLELLSETPAERDLILERLRRLGADGRLRRRYVELLREGWSLVEPIWRENALPALEASARQLAERAARDQDLADLVPALARASDHLGRLAREAQARGELVVAPGYLSGWYLVLDLPGLLLVGTQFDAHGRSQSLRQEMEAVAGELRVLADPTRLAILAQLAECPLSVTELIQTLGLAQPTISTHIRLLRDAGLVRAARNGTRTNYSVDRKRLEDILSRPAEAIVKG